MEIRHVPSCYDKSQIPSLTSTQLVLFDEVHVKQVFRPPSTSRSNEFNILFPRNEEGEVNVERGVYDTKNQLNIASFKYEKEERFCLGVAKAEIQDGKIIGKRCRCWITHRRTLSRLVLTKNKSEQLFERSEELFSH